MSDADEIERIIDTLNTGGLIDREDVAIYFGHLTARIAELEKALKPFVDEFKACRDSYIRRYPRHPAVGADNFDKMPDDWPMETSDFSMGVFRFARTTLEASEHKKGQRHD